MNFVILPRESKMSIDNQVFTINTSSIAANIEIVAFNGDGGVGITEYNDRPRVLNRFVDPTPYQIFIHEWMMEAAQFPDTPLTVSQARTIKKEYVNALFHAKRQVPYSLFGHNFDASDEAVSDIQSQIVSTIYQENTMPSGFTIQSGGWVQTIAGLPPPGTFFIVNTTETLGFYYEEMGANVSVISVARVVVNLSFAQGRTLVAAINSRYSALNLTRVSKHVQINNALTIADIIDVNAVIGW